MNFFKTLKNFLSDLISPPECAFCKKYLEQRAPLCEKCRITMKPLASLLLHETSMGTIPVHALSAYADPLRSLLLAKMKGNRTASVIIGQLLAEHSFFTAGEYDLLIPVPLHWRRYAHRGFNQAQVMAEVVAQKHTKKVVSVVKRVRHTTYQSLLSSDEREKNVQNVFRVTQDARAECEGKRIVIIDDLFTTGATMRALIKVLAPLKPHSITILVACRVVA